MANADFRFAHLVPAGQSGRSTDIGIVVIKRGLPEQRWRLGGLGPRFPIYRRSWSSALGFTLARPGDDWHFASIYSDDMTLQRLIHLPPDDRGGCPGVSQPTLFRCTRYSPASWAEIPILAFSDTIDVTVARFRAAADSVDLYVSSRLPLRWFWTRNLPDARATDSIWYGLTVEDAFGKRFVQSIRPRALPTRELEWREQWMVRVPAVNMMHRVEAFLPAQQQMAIGSRLLTSVDESRFVINDFGMSDVLVADAVSSRTAVTKSMRALDITPNGAVIKPGGTVALAWEIYGLSADSEGIARWNVTISREDGRFVDRGDVRAVIVGSPGANAQVQPNEPGASLIKYNRSERVQPTIVEMLRFGMPNITSGRHVLVLRVEDLVSKRVIERSVSLRVLDPAEQSRKDGWRYPVRSR